MEPRVTFPDLQIYSGVRNSVLVDRALRINFANIGKKKYPEDIKLLWPREYSDAGVQKSLVGPDPEWAYAGAQFTEDGKYAGYNEPVDLNGDGQLWWSGPSYTNLLKYSEQFDNVAQWTKTNTVVISNSAIAPDGNMTADKVVWSTSSGQQHSISTALAPIATVAGQPYTLTFHAKAAEYTTLICFLSNCTQNYFLNADLLTGPLTNTIPAGIAASINSADNGWWRISVTGIAASTSMSILIWPKDHGMEAGDGTSGIYLWGAQLTKTDRHVPYVKTESTTVTVNQIPNYVPAIHGDKGVWCGPSYANLLPSGWPSGSSTINPNLSMSFEGAYRRFTKLNSINSTPITALNLPANTIHTYTLKVRAGSGTTGNKIDIAYYNVTFHPVKVTAFEGPGSYYISPDHSVRVSNLSATEDTTISVTLMSPLATTVSAMFYPGGLGSTEPGASILVKDDYIITPTSVPMPYVPPGTTVTSAAGTSGGNGIGFLLNEELTRIFAGDETKNIVPWSEDFTVWSSSSRFALIPNATISPRGDMTATLMRETFETGDKMLVSHSLGGSSGTYTYSIYCKPAGRNHVRVHLNGGDTYQYSNSVFNIVTGEKLSGRAGAYAEILSDGWCKIVVPNVRTGAGAVTGAYVYLHNGTTSSYTGDGESGVYLWGAQVTRTTTEQPYVATNGIRAGTPATCTVAAEVTTGVGSADVANVADISTLSCRNSVSDLLYSRFQFRRLVSSYDNTYAAYGADWLSWSRYERHIRVVQTNSDGTQFRVGNKRIGIDSAIQWGSWSNFDGSFNPLTHLRLAYGNTVPLWFKRVMVSNRGGMTDAEILARMEA